MLVLKTQHSVSWLAKAFVLLVVLTLAFAMFATVAAGAGGYRADIGVYAEEGFGLIPDFLPFTEVAYRADTGSYAEEGLGHLDEFLPFTESTYRADTGEYAEEGFGLLQ